MFSVQPGPFAGVFFLDVEEKRRLATYQAAPGSVYGERIVEGYRPWDPFRSKLAAFLLKSHGSVDLGLDDKARVLYLGAATGTTVSHVSDIVREGLVYAVEFSPRAMRDLIRLCEMRNNIVPILADAAQPESYCALLEPVDFVYQDVAQRNQAQIASLNSARYLKQNGTLVLMMKTRSIDVVSSPKEVYSSQIQELKGLVIQEVLDLLPYHKDHWAIVAKKT